LKELKIKQKNSILLIFFDLGVPEKGRVPTEK